MTMTRDEPVSDSRRRRRAAVERRAADAALAAEREIAYRQGLLARGKRLATGGKIIVVTGLGGLLLAALLPNRRSRKKEREHEADEHDGPGLVARAGMFLLAAFRWRGLASDAAQLLRPAAEVKERGSPANKA
jgi:tetrahydromethanopterin S-methyltransferase subunit F